MFIKSPFCIENRGAFPIHFTVNIGPQFPRWTNIPSSQVTHTHRDIDRDTAILYYITLHYIVTSPDFPWFSMICHDFPLIFPCIFFSNASARSATNWSRGSRRRCGGTWIPTRQLLVVEWLLMVDGWMVGHWNIFNIYITHLFILNDAWMMLDTLFIL